MYRVTFKTYTPDEGLRSHCIITDFNYAIEVVYYAAARCRDAGGWCGSCHMRRWHGVI